MNKWKSSGYAPDQVFMLQKSCVANWSNDSTDDFYLQKITSNWRKSWYVLRQLWSTLCKNIKLCACCIIFTSYNSEKRLSNIYDRYVYPYLIPCNILWGCVFLLQKKIVRVISGKGYLYHIDPLSLNGYLYYIRPTLSSAGHWSIQNECPVKIHVSPTYLINT